ncbi:MAG: hypothetical protein DRN15_05005 [Thermoprotei archaeon]|nr:MAG: hypothetical protein DRN15_05005 [Thermoprotei archaeon]
MVIMSTSGLRGVSPRDLSPLLVVKATRAYVRALDVRNVVVARDTRPTSQLLAKAVIAALLYEGCRVKDLGICPTPVAFFAVRRLGCDGGIVITGSHNSVEWNAVKFASPKGTFLDAESISSVYRLITEVEFTDNEVQATGSYARADIMEDYLTHVLSHVDVHLIAKRSFRVLLEPGCGTASTIAYEMLKRVGCKVIPLNSYPAVLSRDYEPSKRSLHYAELTLQRLGLDIGMAYDADGDRLVLIDRKHGILRPDYTLALVVEDYVEVHGRATIVVNCATSRLLEHIAKELKCDVVYAPVGEVNVLNEMERVGSPIGGEGSSAGVIVRDVNPTRDGLLASVMILEKLARDDISLDEWVESKPLFYSFHDKIPLPKNNDLNLMVARVLESIDESFKVERIDGVKLCFEDGSWILIRKSRTEPVLRVMGESKDLKRLYLLRSVVLEALGALHAHNPSA